MIQGKGNIFSQARMANSEQEIKKFHAHIKNEQAVFLAALQGISHAEDRERYTSLMFHRLILTYFLQRRGFLNVQNLDQLDGDPHYLRHQFASMKEEQEKNPSISFYRSFLLKLFHEGFNKLPPTAEQRALSGKLPHLQNGLFAIHPLELRYPHITIPDTIFEHLFNFFDTFDWRPMTSSPQTGGKLTAPDILDRIFEKGIARQVVGAYYTEDDIADYISKNTILPHLLFMVRSLYPTAFQADSQLWQPLKATPDRYIYDAIKAGYDQLLPASIAVSMSHTYYQEIKSRLIGGTITSINDLITENLDIYQFVYDTLATCENPYLLLAFYESMQQATILDPTCGSGAFLLAALNILTPLYEICLTRIQYLLTQDEIPPALLTSSSFSQALQLINSAPKIQYAILKALLVNNLYGVDLMEEATEICQLRLMLQLIANITRFVDIEPLPDLDFNICTGNTVVGFTSFNEMREEIDRGLLALSSTKDVLTSLSEQTQEIAYAQRQFRQLQSRSDIHYQPGQKQRIQVKCSSLRTMADHLFFISSYSPDREQHRRQETFEQWQEHHCPFHWFIEYADIMQRGGFTIIMGNPPYVASRDLPYSLPQRQASTYPDLYAYVLIRSLSLSTSQSCLGMITPLSITFTKTYADLRAQLCSSGHTWCSSYDNIPAALFPHVSQRCSIWLSAHAATPQLFVTPMYRWKTMHRPALFQSIHYIETDNDKAVANGIPKLATKAQQQLLNRFYEAKTHFAQPFPHLSSAETSPLGFSQAARNFISVFLEAPPCLNGETLTPVPVTKVGYIHLPTNEMAQAALSLLAGELFFWYWQVRGDGFDVTSWLIRDFLSVLNIPSPFMLSQLAQLGKLLHAHRSAALVFKKNAGRYVGNYNYHKLAFLTRRADLLLLALMKTERSTALEILDYVQCLLAMNKQIGEKAIPEAVKKQFIARNVTIPMSLQILSEIDHILAVHYGFTGKELHHILSNPMTKTLK